MARRKNAISSRDRGQRLLWSLLLVVAGLGGGMLLGEMTTQNLRGVTAGDGASYSGLSANPDASRPVTMPQDTCLDCPYNYGVAAQMRAARNTRMNDAFRELGAVDAAASPVRETTDEYRYGGRFPDADLSASEVATSAEPPAEGVTNPPLSGDAPP
ncbi:hypothetical protein [Sphingopyxis sp. R3-92]|uniref:hypothetical protein n=1 Tax=Sphingopyxis sp. R3-92 TaxID=3158553 RepID=UPI003EE4B0F3